MRLLPGKDGSSTKHPGDLAIYQGKAHTLINRGYTKVIREVGLSCQTYGDDYRSSLPALSVSFTHAVLRCGFLSGLSVLALYLPFTTFWVFFFRCLLFCDFIIITRPEACNSWLFARHIRLVLLTRSLSG